MHFLYFVLVSKDQAHTSEEARSFAKNELESHGFADQDKFFNRGKSDWFVVGGRWSGFLTQAYHLFFAQARELLKEQGAEIYDIGIPEKSIKENNSLLQLLWKELNGNYDNPNPIHRDQYLDLGCEDDACVLTQEVLATISEALGENPETEVFDTSEIDEFSILNVVKHQEGYFNNYWIVVIDYHN